MIFKFVLFDCRISIVLSYVRKGLITVNELHKAEPFWRSLEFLSWLRNPPKFTKLEVSFPCSEEPATCPYAEPHKFSSYLPFYY
jgi:hypothetical protein